MGDDMGAPKHILVYSIPHTGTHWLDNVLESNQIPFAGSVHITKDLEDLNPYDLILVPLRDPRDVATSWEKRRELRGAQAWKAWLPSWETVAKIKDDPRVHFVIVDGDREREHWLLEEALDKDLDIDWTPLNHMEYEPKVRVIKPFEITYAYWLYRTIRLKHELHGDCRFQHADCTCNRAAD